MLTAQRAFDCFSYGLSTWKTPIQGFWKVFLVFRRHLIQGFLRTEHLTFFISLTYSGQIISKYLLNLGLIIDCYLHKFVDTIPQSLLLKSLCVESFSIESIVGTALWHNCRLVFSALATSAFTVNAESTVLSSSRFFANPADSPYLSCSVSFC